MQDAYLDPANQDYRLNAGQLARDPAAGLANAVYLRLMTPLGSYWADPALGSRLHELQREKDIARVPRLAQQYAELALQPLLLAARARKIEIVTQRDAGRLSLVISLTQTTGATATFTHPVKIAG
jgi:phage gp46-like protein